MARFQEFAVQGLGFRYGKVPRLTGPLKGVLDPLSR